MQSFSRSQGIRYGKLLPMYFSLNILFIANFIRFLTFNQQ